ncbi:MAG: hypothetical protein IPJ65_38730 [Archangiaceae bacterium]|nr:hypothetical protein [Archangiaceae bacterium]
MKRLSAGAAAAVGLLLACSGSGPQSTGTGGGAGTAGGSASAGGAGTAGGSGTAGGAGGSAGGSSPSALDQAQCEAGLNRFAAAGCSDAAQYTQLKQTVCPKVSNASSAVCSAALTRAEGTYSQLQSASFYCTSFGTTDSADPAAVDFLLAVFCVTSMNSNLCAGLACAYNTDCPTGYTCNDATDKCVKTDAACIGLPCKYNVDCPTGLTCNNAIGQCSKS